MEKIVSSSHPPPPSRLKHITVMTGLGRTTPSLRSTVKRQVERINKLLSLLPSCEAEKAREILDGIDETLSLYTHTNGPVDPVELLLVHIIRKMASGECRNELLDNRRRTLS